MGGVWVKGGGVQKVRVSKGEEKGDFKDRTVPDRIGWDTIAQYGMMKYSTVEQSRVE
jgi:hypothetical protein